MATPASLEQPGSLISLSHLPVAFDAGCWIWHGPVDNGYGRLTCGRRRGKRDTAHRWMYKRLVGSIPEGLELDHLCRHKRCVNPAHLEPVTTAENQRRGDACKLDWEMVRFIRANCVPRHSEFSMRALGRRFGITHETVRKIVNQTSWVEAQAS